MKRKLRMPTDAEEAAIQAGIAADPDNPEWTEASVWVDPDDAPEITEAFLEHAEVRDGDKIVHPGRPPLLASKRAVSLRLDPDLLAALRADGPDWQSRANDALRKAMKLKGG